MRMPSGSSADRGRVLAQLDRERDPFTVGPDDLDVDPVARLARTDGLPELVRRRDLLSAERDDDVADLDAGGLRRAARDHVDDRRALISPELEGELDLG